VRVIFICLAMVCILGCKASTDFNDYLVIHYPFDGNANDESGNGNHGLESGGLTYTRGVVGRAASLDGIDDYIEIPNNMTVKTSNFTLAFWVKTKMKPTGLEEGYIISSSEDMSSCNHGYNLHLDIDGLLYFWIEQVPKCNVSEIQSDSQINDGEWHHIVALYDSCLRLYVDGVPQSAIVKSSYNKTGQTVRIGMHRDTKNKLDNTFFEGFVDEFRLYNCALSHLKIEELLKLPIASPE
jgi:hypothetical protein